MERIVDKSLELVAILPWVNVSGSLLIIIMIIIIIIIIILITCT